MLRVNQSRVDTVDKFSGSTLSTRVHSVHYDIARDRGVPAPLLTPSSFLWLGVSSGGGPEPKAHRHHGRALEPMFFKKG